MSKPAAATLRLAVAACAAAVTLPWSAPAAALPTTALIEGTLSTAGGGPAADGNYGVKVSLYKDAVGGTPLWSEQATLAVAGGQFQHALGSVAPVGQAVLQAAAYIAIAVASDPELARKPLHGVLFAARAGTAESVACSGCIALTQLDSALQADFKSFVKGSDLADVAKSGNFSDLNGAPVMSTYAKVADLKKVATSGSYNDLIDKPVFPKAGSACGTDLVVKGFKADGSLDCVAGAGLAPDLIDEVSNNLIFNTFVEAVESQADIEIPDFAGAGVTTSVLVPDLGTAKKIWFAVDLTNSDLSAVKIELYGPGMAQPYLVYNGGKSGTELKAKFNDDTPLVSGDMNKDWVGKSIKGTWSVIVRDSKDNVAGSTDGKFTWSIAIEVLSTKKIEIKGDLNVTGKLTVGTGASPTDIIEFKNCALTDKTGPCVVSFTPARAFVDAAKFCGAMKADICTDSQAFGARRQSVYMLQASWTNSFADNDGGQWTIANGGTGDDHPATSYYSTPCCFNVTPTQQGEQKVGGVRVLKVNNAANKTWNEAVDACFAVNADLCDKGQYYVLRQQGVVTVPVWSSDHSDNDGNVCSSSVGGTSDDPSPGQQYGFACCATGRTSLACPAPNTEVGGVCVAKVFNSNSYAFSTAATNCASMGARICSTAQSAVLRSAGVLSCPGNWSASHADNDSGYASVGVGNASDNPNDGNALGYACCF